MANKKLKEPNMIRGTMFRKGRRVQYKINLERKIRDRNTKVTLCCYSWWWDWGWCVCACSLNIFHYKFFLHALRNFVKISVKPHTPWGQHWETWGCPGYTLRSSCPWHYGKLSLFAEQRSGPSVVGSMAVKSYTFLISCLLWVSTAHLEVELPNLLAIL